MCRAALFLRESAYPLGRPLIFLRRDQAENTMSTAKLFTTLRVGNIELKNRILIAPMCQYSAVDGCMTDWHLIHLGMLANSGAALLCFEMTDVDAIGRITPGCSGLYSDANESAL